jgi:alanine dehydrogenase
MIIGAPKEIKSDEYRVSLLPFGVELLAKAGHQVLVQSRAGEGSGVTDDEYARAGAKVAKTPAEVFAADLVVKVKEPQPVEYPMLRPGQAVFTYFHFAADRALTEAMMAAKIVAIAYETIELDDGTLPLLTPMSEVAGRMAVHEGAKYLEEPLKGRGILLAGVPGVEPAKVVIIGGGVVGANAAKMAAGLGADVTILDISLPRLRYLDDIMPPNVNTMMSNPYNIRRMVQEADLLVGAVLVTGDKAPVLVTEAMVKTMKKGAVIVDVAVDQGGCIETTRPTTHSNPTYIVHDVVHYCVANMPGALARTSTYALCNATFPYLRELADKGHRQAALDNRAIARGLNIVEGQVVFREIATLFGLPCAGIEKVLKS